MPKPKLRPSLSASFWWPRIFLLALLAPVILSLFGQDIIPYSADKPLALCVLALCALWARHLLAAGMGGVWSLLYAGLLAAACILSLPEPMTHPLWVWLHAFGCGIFLYAMLWAFGLYEQKGGLQAVATAALVLSFGVLAKPPLLVLCVLFCAIFLFPERRLAGGPGKLFLLLFTPLLLCLLSLALLGILYHGGILKSWWAVALPVQAARLDFSSSLHDLWPLAFGLVTLLGRLIAGKSGRPDLLYLSTAILLPDLRLAPWIPAQLCPLDFSIMLVCGAACLLATAPPLRVRERLIFLAGLAASLACCLPEGMRAACRLWLLEP